MLKNLIEVSEEIKQPVVDTDNLREFPISQELAHKLEDGLPQLNELTISKHTSFIKTSSENFAIIPNQYFSLACHLYDFTYEIIKYFRKIDDLQGVEISTGESLAEILFGDWKKIKDSILGKEELYQYFENEEELELFCKVLDQNDKNLFRLKGKNIVNYNNGKYSLRGYDDCFGSIILTQINIPVASSSIFGDIAYYLTLNNTLFDELNRYHADLFREKEVFPSPVSSGAQGGLVAISKPFLLLAGISGTGKTRFVREQAKLSSDSYNLNLGDNYCLVPVRPDWHEPSDLLGYVSRIGQTGARYVVSDLLRFIVSAWKASAQSADEEGIVCKTPDEMCPYWLCLDEMNLAPVEQYFADYLSVLETRRLDDGEYDCEPLLKSSTILQLDENGREELWKDLGLEGDDLISIGLKEHFLADGKGIPLPPNLIVAGTVNMDETTHGFSRKVIDRALTLDFGEFYPNDYAQFYQPTVKSKPLFYPTVSQVKESNLSGIEVDPNGNKTIAFLTALNKVLSGTPFELAYRALNEALLSVVCFNPPDDKYLQAVWDDFMMMKVLPRIEGDAEKLQDNGEQSLLTRLLENLEALLPLIWNAERPDLLRETIEGEPTTLESCRSKKKIEWMQERLNNNGFTTFWP